MSDVTVLYGPDGVSSSWVSSVAYVDYSGELGVAITFKDGTTCFYPDTKISDYQAMSNASSPGTLVHQRYVGLDYDIIDL